MPCKYSPCRASYLGEDFKGNPLDPSKPLQGPYGTGISGPVFGLCPGMYLNLFIIFGADV